MVETRPDPVDPGYCLFGSAVLKKHAEDLAAEADGVRAAADIEHIHRMRVASRRLRAALPLFEECFGQDTIRRWRREIRNVTRALGEARDADVQIEFLRSYLETLPGVRGGLPSPLLFAIESGSPVQAPALPPEKAETPGRSPLKKLFAGMMARLRRSPPPPDEPPVQQFSLPGGTPLRPGVECLLLRLSQARRDLQPAVVRAMDGLDTAGTVGEIVDVCRKRAVRGRMEGTDVHSGYAFEQAFIQISVCLDNLFSYEDCVADPDARARHHEMRIAAKRLRYTMETFGPLYPGELKAEIGSIKKLQDFLGDIHDCDVWADFLPVFLEEERVRCRTYFGHDALMAAIEPGIVHLREERTTRRREIFDVFAAYWRDLRKNGYWDGLGETIAAALRDVRAEALRLPSGDGGPVKIALIGDVHGNLPALEAVLQDARQRGAIAVLDAGDAVGYGPFPDETVRHLRRQRVLSVIGNYDRQVLASRGKKKGLPKNLEKRLAIRWAYRHLSKEERSYLGSLPEHRRIALGDRRLLLCHGSPETIDEHLDGDTPAYRLAEIAGTAGADIVVSGHAHCPSVREVAGVWFVNTGSVGRPDDGDPRACYALLQTDPFSVCHLRIPYNIDRTVAAVFEQDLPPSFARMFREGRSLDAFMEGERPAAGRPENVSVSCTVGEDREEE
ncbi:MAG: hypothetical protein PWP08_698 [Methanofollis sp.]|nr:hypothetical protein [Methanofollis sp.]